jgi:hypothetical protein
MENFPPHITKSIYHTNTIYPQQQKETYTNMQRYFSFKKSGMHSNTKFVGVGYFNYNDAWKYVPVCVLLRNNFLNRVPSQKVPLDICITEHIIYNQMLSH